MARVVSLSGCAKMSFKATAKLDVRYSFTSQFLVGSAMFAQRAREIEDDSQTISEENRTLHRALVVSAIIQSVAALEAEISEVVIHGPGHHLGSNGIDKDARDFLMPLKDVLLDRSRTLECYERILHLLRKPVDKGTEPFQSATTLVHLRNGLIHYKSRWGKDLESEDLIKALRILNFKAPPFVQASQNFFPHHVLCSSCASWAVTTAKKFIDCFYARLNIQSPLRPYESRIAVPAILRESKSKKN
jgi:hypothetical protein